MALVKNKVSNLKLTKTKTGDTDIVRASWDYPKGTKGDMQYFKQFTVIWKYSYGEKVGSNKIWYTNSTSINTHETDTTFNFTDFSIPSVDPDKYKHIYIYVKVTPECNKKKVEYTNEDGDTKTKNVDAWTPVETKSSTVTYDTQSLVTIETPPTPTIARLSDGKLKFEIFNYDSDGHAKSVKIQTRANGDSNSGKTYKVNLRTKSASVVSTNKMSAGNYYQVRAKGYSEKDCDGKASEEWSAWSSPIYAEPKTPKGEFKIQVAKRDGADAPNVQLYDTSQKNADYIDEYELQYTPDVDDFGSNNRTTRITTIPFKKDDEKTGVWKYDTERKALHFRGYFDLQEEEMGDTLYFRIRSKKGDYYSGWSTVISKAFGTKPDAPTVWLTKNVYEESEGISLFYTHNTTDGSYMKKGTFKITFNNESGILYEFQSDDFSNEKVNEDYEEPSYSIEWVNLYGLLIYIYGNIENIPDGWQSGKYTVAFQVRTAGNAVEKDGSPAFSNWSSPQYITIWAKPTLELSGTDSTDWLWDPFNFLYDSIETAFTGAIFTSPVRHYPIFIQVESGPEPQQALYYTFNIEAKNDYEIMGFDGIMRQVTEGTNVYSATTNPTRRYDGELNGNYTLVRINPWDVVLQNGETYILKVTAVMNSGLVANLEYEFETEFDDYGFIPDADIIINDDSYSMTIIPKLDDDIEYEEGELPLDISDVVFHVWRRNYDDTMTNIASAITGELLTGVIDPHPLICGGLYRIVAMSKITGEVTYTDVQSPKFDKPGIIIQWAQDYQDYTVINDNDNFDLSETDIVMFGSGVTGSQLFLPYNVDVSSSYGLDTELIEYLGREHPVSYYGMQTGESMSLNTVIPAEGSNDIVLAMRRLSIYRGDCYIREPSGVGFWAKVEISFNINHLSVTIPISITATRVEGGI